MRPPAGRAPGWRSVHPRPKFRPRRSECQSGGRQEKTRGTRSHSRLEGAESWSGRRVMWRSGDCAAGNEDFPSPHARLVNLDAVWTTDPHGMNLVPGAPGPLSFRRPLLASAPISAQMCAPAPAKRRNARHQVQFVVPDPKSVRRARGHLGRQSQASATDQRDGSRLGEC